MISKKVILILALTIITSNVTVVAQEAKTVVANEVKVDLIAVESEAKEFISSMFNFFQTGLIEDAEKVFSKDAILIGTDEAEYYTGWEEVKPSIIAQQAAIKDAKFDTRNLRLTVSSCGTMVAYTSVVDFSFTAGGEPGKISNVRNSGSIVKDNGKWSITQIHWSMGVAGQVVEY
jgi:hypothetical protein